MGYGKDVIGLCIITVKVKVWGRMGIGLGIIRVKVRMGIELCITLNRV